LESGKLEYAAMMPV